MMDSARLVVFCSSGWNGGTTFWIWIEFILISRLNGRTVKFEQNENDTECYIEVHENVSQMAEGG